MDSANLEYREGSSDKVYTAEIVPVAAGFVVNFAYGRRGNTMTTGTKTAQPVDYAKAKKIFDALIDSKKGLSDELLAGGGEINLTEMKDADIMRLVALDLHTAMTE